MKAYKEALESIQSLQPKTEESPIVIEESTLENEWRKLKEQPYIPTEKEQPTSPSKSDDIEQIIIDQINQSFNEYQGTNEAIQDAAYFLARRFQGYKDRLDELEKWVKQQCNGIQISSISTEYLLNKIKELKNK